MSRHPSVHTEVGGPVLTPSYRVLVAIAALGGVMMLWRFAAGLAAVSNLNDGYPWGIWIAFDVVTGTALGCGGYAVALLVYILNKGEYHPLVRPAILTSLLGYGLAVLAVTVDLGRFWELWKVPVYFWRWSHSPQLEVALCVAIYVLVLLIELSPAFFEKWRKSPDSGLRSFAEKGLAFVKRYFVWILALGILLPDHAPVLARDDDAADGAEAAPAVVHALAAVPVPRQLHHHGLRRRGAREPRRPPPPSAAGGRPRCSAGSRRSRCGWRSSSWPSASWTSCCAGRPGPSSPGSASRSSSSSAFSWRAPCVLASEANRRRPGQQALAALLLVVGGTVYRFNVYLVGFRPGENWSYFPAVPELLITFGIVALEIALYVAAVKTFPILAGEPEPARA